MMKVLISTFLIFSTAALANGFSSVGAVNGVGPTGGEELQPIEDLLPSQAQDIKDANDMLSVASQHFSEDAQVKIRQLSAKMRERATETDPTRLQTLNSDISALEDAIKAEATAAELAAAREFYVEISQLDGEARAEAFDTPQPQDPDNPFYITASHTTRVWNRGIQLSAYGGMNGTVSYHMSGGDCQVTVEGLVISPGRPAACTIYAKRTASAGFFQQSDPITVNFTLECPEEGQALSASASATSANVGESVTISASGGGCVGIFQYFEASPVCNVTSNGVVTGTRAGDCPITVTKSSEGSINPSQQQIVTISFVDPNEGGTLSLSANNVSPAVNETANLIVSGGIGEPLFGVRGNGCSVNSNGTVSGSGQPRTCEAYVNKGSQTASVCINFGGGGPNPPVGCAPVGSLDGPLVIQAPTGPVSMTETTTVDGDPAYFGSYQLTTTGGGTGTLRFESYSSPVGCTVSQNGIVTASTTQTGITCTATARRFGGPEGTVLSQNSVTIVFGDADPADGGSQEFQPLVISSSAGLSANVGDTLQLSFTGGRSGNPIFGNAGQPTGCSITTDGVVSRATRGLCYVNAYDAPDTSNALCIAFGDVTVSADGTCTEVADQAPTLSFSASTSSSNAPGEITFTASLSRDLRSGESIEIYATTVGGVDPLSQGCFHGGNREYPFVNAQTPRSEHVRTMFCPSPGTYKLEAVLNWLGETVVETVCVRYGEGSENAECPSLSYVAPEAEETEDAGEIDFEVMDAYALDERVVLTATGAGDSPSWLVQRSPVFNSRLGYPDSNLVTCSSFVGSVPTEREIEVRYYPAICKVTLRHSDDTTNQVTKCLSFGDVNVPANQQDYVSTQCGASL